jgi:serine protease AprX
MCVMGRYRGFLCALTWLVAGFAHSGIISPQAEAAIREANGGPVDLVFYVFSESPFKIARSAKADFDPQIRFFSEQVKEYAQVAQLRALTALEVANRRQAMQAIDEIQDRRAERVSQALRDAAFGNIEAVRNAIESFGGSAMDPSYILPSIRGIVPSSAVKDLAANSMVTYVDIHFVGGPLLDNQRQSLGVSVAGFWTNGYTGGIFDVGLIDTGVQRNHPAFAGLDWEGVETDPDGHGTGVGGMMFSNDTTYRGLSYGVDTVCAADAETGMRVSTDWLLTQTFQRPEAINVSWGGQVPDPEEYGLGEMWYDAATDAFNVTFGQAAGNEGGAGYTTLGSPAKAYNTIAVANVFDNNTVTRTDDVIQGSSSRGPTPNGRKKPDIAAPGHQTHSTTRTLGFGDLGGTSSAAPKVTAGAMLLRDFGTTSSIEDKAVLINSADSWSDNNTVASGDDGPVNFGHWSRSYGWGYLNLLKAYQQAPYVIADTFERPIIVGLRRIAYYSGSRASGFKSTLTWNRHVGPYSIELPTGAQSLTNFNLSLYNSLTGALVNESTSTIDNVEQVWSNTTGGAVLKVHTTGTWDVDVPSEDYALAVPALFARKDPPRFEGTINVTSYAVVGNEVSVGGTVTNTGELPVFDVLASVNGHVVGGINPVQLGTLDPGETVPFNWAIEVNQSPGPQNVRISFSGTGYGENFSSYIEQQVNVIPFFLPPTTHTVIRGNVTGGDLSSVTTSNNVYLQVRPGITFTTSQWPVEMVFRRVSPVTTPRFFYVRTESQATAASIKQRFEAFNYNTNAWVVLDESNLALTDAVRIYSVPGTVTHFQHPSTREVQLRVSAKAFGPVFAYPWAYRLDQIGWHIDD